VCLPDDLATHLNTKLLRKLNSSQLVVCGQALSHCVNFTIRDIVDNWRGNNSNITILEDGKHILILIVVIYFIDISFLFDGGYYYGCCDSE
jgi:hypothetical protein